MSRLFLLFVCVTAGIEENAYSGVLISSCHRVCWADIQVAWDINYGNDARYHEYARNTNTGHYVQPGII